MNCSHFTEKGKIIKFTKKIFCDDLFVDQQRFVGQFAIFLCKGIGKYHDVNYHRYICNGRLGNFREEIYLTLETSKMKDVVCKYILLTFHLYKYVFFPWF